MKEWVNLIETVQYDAQATLYHGTSTTARAKKIMKEGIKAQEDTAMGRTARAALTPVQGHVYLTPSIKYACIYAIGGNMVGHKIRPDFFGKEKYGYVFVVEPRSIQLQPDEDEVGYAIREAPDILSGESKYSRHMDNMTFGQALIDNPTVVRSLYHLAQSHLTKNQQKRIWNGINYDILAQAGKKILKVMPSDMKKVLIDMGAHVSSPEVVIPDQTWRFKKSDSEKLGFQAENFFEVATRIA